MMPVHVYAIQLSKDGPDQYVMQRSLDVVGVIGKNQRDSMIRDGYKQIARYHNGVGYRSYRINSSEDVVKISYYLERKNILLDIFPYTIHFSFQEFFAENCESEWLNVDISFFCNFDKPKTIRLEGEDAKQIEDFLISQSIDLEYCVL